MSEEAPRHHDSPSLPSIAMERPQPRLDSSADALRQAEAIAFFFPTVRAGRAEVDALVEELVNADESRLAEACDDLPEAERRRIVDSWATRHPERWSVLVGEARDLRAAERALVVGALRATVGDSKPCDPVGLAEIDAARVVHPGNALAAVIQPATVWEYELAAEAAAAAGTADRERAIAAIGFRHFARCRSPLLARVAWVREQLPFRPFPRASAALRGGCDLVAASPRFGEELACAVLEGYVRLLEDGFPGRYITSLN